MKSFKHNMKTTVYVNVFISSAVYFPKQTLQYVNINLGPVVHIDYLLAAALRRSLQTGDYIRRGHHQILYFLLYPTDSNRNLK